MHNGHEHRRARHGESIQRQRPFARPSFLYGMYIEVFACNTVRVRRPRYSSQKEARGDFCRFDTIRVCGRASTTPAARQNQGNCVYTQCVSYIFLRFDEYVARMMGLTYHLYTCAYGGARSNCTKTSFRGPVVIVALPGVCTGAIIRRRVVGIILLSE